ncbi:hypothetical protein BTA30_07750 [Bacillus swezeyi]|uniref:Uncharacterized protein n=1 Tax=Bacillus swezeyi TaxID=1925020 RepID=A0A1R1RZQ9_9BACI|nr:hypothetical protein BW143_13885 [Bacillus swezeyi]OMI31483.1 hypothetical protein BTA30_07750 [Bacillus swezeyi]
MSVIFVIVLMSGSKVKYEGSGNSGLWCSSIEKSDKTSIGPNYFLNLYWQGSKEDENSSFGQANDLEHFQIE